MVFYIGETCTERVQTRVGVTGRDEVLRIGLDIRWSKKRISTRWNDWVEGGYSCIGGFHLVSLTFYVGGTRVHARAAVYLRSSQR